MAHLLNIVSKAVKVRAVEFVSLIVDRKTDQRFTKPFIYTHDVQLKHITY